MRGYLRKQKLLKASCINKAHPAWVAAHKGWELGHTASPQAAQLRLQSVLSKCLWSKPPVTSSHGFGFFQTAGLASAPLQFGFPLEKDPQFLLFNLVMSECVQL